MATIAQYVRKVPKGTLALIAVIAAIVVVVAVVLLAQSPTDEAGPAGAEDTPVPTVAAQAAARAAAAATAAASQATPTADAPRAEPTATAAAATPADAGEVSNWSEERAQARVEVEQQVATSRTGLPTAGDTLIDETGFEVTLVGVANLPELKQFTGSPFKPKHGVFKLVNIEFKNGTSSLITLAKSNIVVIAPDGSEIDVSNLGTNALTGMVPDVNRGRPLYLVESLPAGKSARVSVVFDVPADLTGLNIEIEGFLFEVPDPT